MTCKHYAGLVAGYCNDCNKQIVPEIPRAIRKQIVPEIPRAIRAFETGATRSADADRYDPEGCLSPLIIERFCEYMNRHRVAPDGTVRASDNWQKGMPLDTYIKGLLRHLLHAWTRHRGQVVRDPKAAENIEEDLCAIIFNAQGYLYELLKKHSIPRDAP